MDSLQSVVAYWRDCIKSEGALEQNFGINKYKFGLSVRTRAALFEGKSDPFIFAQEGFDYFVEKGKTHDLIARSNLKGQEIYFGYPLLMFFDKVTKQNRVAPLFVMRLDVEHQKDRLKLTRAESMPTLGSSAFEKLGLKQEEIAALNSEISEIFDSNKTSKLETVLYLLKKETQLTFIEGIDPKCLSPAETIHPYDGTVVYNKAILFASEASIYNIHILNDMEKLVKRTDLHESALKYIDTPTPETYSDFTPILPFQFDEYQLRAIQRILGSDHTVVTGPPGTGKSQFIANLIVNLFLQGKKVLFVSHTGEAVRVVNERVNQNFANLMMQTGKKEIRQDLGRRLDQMVEQYNDQQTTIASAFPLEAIAANWKAINQEIAYLRKTDKIHKRLESKLYLQQVVDQRSGLVQKLSRRIIRLQVNLTAMNLRRRSPNFQVLEHIENLKNRHVDISQAYVKANYLNLILDNGLYGKLVAYIDAVQNKKFTDGHEADKSEKYITIALKAMNIWSCTLKSLAATFPLRSSLFDYVIFDEASQIDLPSAAPALYRAKRAVIVGDENQLTHIAKITSKLEEELAQKYALAGQSFYPALVRYTDASLFNSAKKALSEPEQELKNHYRSNTVIAKLFSTVFYGGRLKIHEPDSTLPPDIQSGVRWIDVKGSAYKHKTGSHYNAQEVGYIIKLLKQLIPVANERNLTIGITTPYSYQCDLLSRKIDEAFDADQLANVRVLTVHKFQGSEVDILIFSVVLAIEGDGSSDYWYMKNKQILNVAISRAKQLLLIVGDLDFALNSSSKLKEIAQYCQPINNDEDAKIPNRPMNIFEKQLLALLKKTVPKTYKIEPQYVVDNRFTVDFVLISKQKKIAIELDGRQHEIVGGLPVFEDKKRDAYLAKKGWHIIRITVHDLVKQPFKVAEVLGHAMEGHTES